MKQITENLLTQKEQLDLYALPVLTPEERTEYFTFNHSEVEILKSFSKADEAICFAVKLAFFKIKHAFIDFTYREITEERRHVMDRYFPDKSYPLSLTSNRRILTRIENKVLFICGYHRCHTDMRNQLIRKLQKISPRYPKQRALCRALLDLCMEMQIAIPGITTLQTIIRDVWNEEQERILKAYTRYTTKSQRNEVLSLLEKNEQTHTIIEIRQEMKSFSTSEIEKTLDQHAIAAPIFNIAKEIIPKLNIPKNSVYYYADLINYYKGTRLKNLNIFSVQIYLLCYCFIRFQTLNDHLLEAFRKRVTDYKNKANKEAEAKSSAYLATMKEVRKQLSHMLMAIKETRSKTHVPKSTLYQYIPESELEPTALMLLNDKLDPDILFWQAIDKLSGSIKLNIRPVFLALDLVILRHESLKCAIEYLRDQLINSKNKSSEAALPSSVEKWLGDNKEYIVVNEKIILRRLEYWIYYQMSEQIKSNKLTLKYTVKYKSVQDDLMPEEEWSKDKQKILKQLNHPKLSTSPQNLANDLKKTNAELFQSVNHSIMNGENSDVIISTNAEGTKEWHLKPLKEENPPNDSLFAKIPKCSIVHAMRFVEEQLNFTRVFDSILSRGAKHDRDPHLILAAILANALRLGSENMANISDLNVHSLLSVESGCIRMETITAAINLIHEAASQFPIFKSWYINDLSHGNIDGMRVAVQFLHSKARHSKKHFGRDAGVSSLNLILNHFPMSGLLIGSNEYEGHFAFELSQFQCATNIHLDILSTDKHGMNSMNFALFYLINMVFAPRIPKPHNEILWGFDSYDNYRDYIIQPTKLMNEKNFIHEWDNLQHVVASMLIGEGSPSIIINKMSSGRFTGKTKLAFNHFNSVIKSNFMLRCMNDNRFRHAIERALNRGEAFNRLYRAIALLNKGKLRGHSDVEMMIWDACTRLLAAIILYYNTYILNMLYETTTDPQAKAFLLRAVPTAWDNINLLGRYQFYGDLIFNIEHWVKNWDWQSNMNFG